MLFALLAAWGFISSASAQGIAGTDPYTNQRIETVTVLLSNPSQDEGLNARVEDRARSALDLFPGVRFSRQLVDLRLSRARRVRGVADVTYEVTFGRQGGLDITLIVVLETAEAPEVRKGLGRFPVLYERDGTYLRAKLDLLALYYANDNAWYGRPDLMLAGNPLVSGTPAGEGYDSWIEAYAHYGLYGITPINEQLYIYGGASGIIAHSNGQELFTDVTRTKNGLEDAYLGVVGGNTDDEGNRFLYNVSAGRQRFTLANGFLIANTAANGNERAALQANARWASDLLVHARVRYNNTMIEVFYLDPDELPVVDSESTYFGANLELEPIRGLELAVSYLTVPDSSFNYFSPEGLPAGTREGLRVYDARFTYAPNGQGVPGVFIGGEYAVQSNRNFSMDARAGWGEIGYVFRGQRWAPTLSYRYARFSGDDPGTTTFERWDPLLSGGTGEQWVQGANHFKVVQDSNVVAHRLQGRLRVSPKIELVPQFWAFYADSRTNVGGNPALSFLEDDEYGYEANVTVKWFANSNTYVHGHIAYTKPGEATKAALNDSYEDWLSVMLFARYAF